MAWWRQLTQAERDTIVVLCQLAIEAKAFNEETALKTYPEFTADDWARVLSILYKLDKPDPDLLPGQG